MAFKATTIREGEREGRGNAGRSGVLRVFSVLGAVAGLLSSPSNTLADAIRHNSRAEHPGVRVARTVPHRQFVHPAGVQTARVAYWTEWAATHGNYFGWALQTRDARVAVPRWVQLQSINGLLPQTPVVQYLEWRRGLDPIRFDRYHPWWSSQLATDQAIRAADLPNPLPIVATIPPTPTSPIAPTGFPVTPEQQRLTVPEPTSGAILLVLLATSGFVSHWKSKRTRNGILDPQFS